MVRWFSTVYGSTGQKRRGASETILHDSMCTIGRSRAVLGNLGGTSVAYMPTLICRRASMASNNLSMRKCHVRDKCNSRGLKTLVNACQLLGTYLAVQRSPVIGLEAKTCVTIRYCIWQSDRILQQTTWPPGEIVLGVRSRIA